MSDQLLNTLKVALLALLYLFFARVLWAVWTEVRVPVAAGIAPKVSGAGKAVSNVPARLLMVEPANMRGSVTTLESDVVVGRAPECTVVMPEDPYTSTRHARFFERDGAWWVEDLGSTNGTLVNAKPITEAQQLKRDDRVQTGSAVFEVQ